jgi:hypothetical protein
MKIHFMVELCDEYFNTSDEDLQIALCAVKVNTASSGESHTIQHRAWGSIVHPRRVVVPLPHPLARRITWFGKCQPKPEATRMEVVSFAKGSLQEKRKKYAKVGIFAES